MTTAPTRFLFPAIVRGPALALGLPLIWCLTYWERGWDQQIRFYIAPSILVITWLLTKVPATLGYADGLKRHGIHRFVIGCVYAILANGAILFINYCWAHGLRASTLRELISNGQLSFFVSCITFAYTLHSRTLVWEPQRTHIVWPRAAQYFVFTVALGVYTQALFLEAVPTSAVVLSLATFAIITDWYSLDRYAVSEEKEIAPASVVKYLAYDLVILVCSYLTMLCLPNVENTWVIYKVFLAFGSAVVFVIVACALALYPYKVNEGTRDSLEVIEKRCPIHVPEPSEILPDGDTYICVLVQGKKKQGGPFWVYLAVPRARLSEFKAAEAAGNYVVNDYGIVVCAGDEKEPPEDIVLIMQHKYGTRPSLYRSFWGKLSIWWSSGHWEA